MNQGSFTGLAKSCLKADLAIYNHIVDACGQCMSVSLILSFKLDLSSCAIWDGFCKSSHNFNILCRVDH